MFLISANAMLYNAADTVYYRQVSHDFIHSVSLHPSFYFDLIKGSLLLGTINTRDCKARL